MKEKKDFPLKIKVGFKKVFEAYRESVGKSALAKKQYSEILDLETNFPLLSSGIADYDKLSKYENQIDIILDPLFPAILETNEIKFATIPFHTGVFKSTKRFKDILMAAGDDFSMDIINFDEDQFYIMGCSIILSHYYGKKVDFKRSFYYNIPDGQGIIKNYRLFYNADCVR